MIFLLQVIGFMLLASAMHATPARLRLARTKNASRIARAAGVGLLLLSFIALMRQERFGIALLTWFGLATFGAMLVLITLALTRLGAGSRR